MATARACRGSDGGDEPPPVGLAARILAELDERIAAAIATQNSDELERASELLRELLFFVEGR